MFIGTVVKLPKGTGDPFSLENLLKLNADNNWEQRFREMLRDTLREQLQKAITYYRKLESGQQKGAVCKDGRWIIHLDELSPTRAAQLLWIEAHRVPRSIIKRPEALGLRSRLADQLWQKVGVESHLSETTLNHYQSLVAFDDIELHWLMTTYRLGLELRTRKGEEPARLDHLAAEAMLVPGTDYFFSTGEDPENESAWLRAVLVGLMLP